MKTAGVIEQVANAVLYEGFLLYPYRLSSVKNRRRWNFGVIYPQPFAGANGERDCLSTEVLFEGESADEVQVKLRFLQLVEGSAVEREVIVSEPDFFFSDGKARAKVETRREQAALGPRKISVKIINLGCWDGQDRDGALERALISAHVVFSAANGRFISLIDPPEQFRDAASQCRGDGLWPVLAGSDERHVLAAPIILYDHPRIAPQSPGDLFDGTEIDEILTLRIQTLTDAEKFQVRREDSRARALLDRSEALTREEMARLHAPMRVDFKNGDRVRLRPRRRADIFDIALAGKLATVVSVEQDFEDGVHLCVTIDDDPGKDLGLDGKPGHRFFFSADEVEPA